MATHRDPVCGMTADPGRAAGVSERDGVAYYFCSPGCKEKFDAGSASVEAQTRAGCRGGGAASTAVRLTAAGDAGEVVRVVRCA